MTDHSIPIISMTAGFATPIELLQDIGRRPDVVPRRFGSAIRYRR